MDSHEPPAPLAGAENEPRAASLRAVILNLGWMLGGKGFSAVLSALYLAVVTRSLGVEGFGQFALVLGTMQATEIITTFQSSQIVVRYGMPHLAEGRHGQLSRLLAFTTRIDIGTALIGSALVVGAGLLLRDRFGWSEAFVWQAIAASIVFTLSTHWTPIGVLRLFDRFATATYADAVTPLVRCIGALTVWLIQPTVIGFLAAWVIAELLTAAAYWYAALHVKGLTWRLSESLRWRVIAAENPGIGRYALTTNLASTLDLGGRQIAVLVVGILATPAAAGAFRLAQQLASAVAKLSTLVTRALFPEMMRSLARARISADFEMLLARTSRLTAIGGAAVFLLLLLIGKQALVLVAGQAFVGAYPILLLLGTGAALDFAVVGFEPALVALGRPGLALRLRIATTSVMLALMLFLAKRYGGAGAGAAIVAASMLAAILFGYNLRRLLRRQRATAGDCAGVDPAS